MSVQLDNLKAEVTRIKTVNASVKALLGSLSDRIEELKDDPAQLQALADEVRAEAD